MKAHLLYADMDLDLDAALPPGHEDLVQDLEAATVFDAMSAGDRYLFDLAERVLLTSLGDPARIRYRQEILADCLAHPEIVREMYAIAVGALEDQRGIWGLSSRLPGSVLSVAVHQLEAFVVRLSELARLAAEHRSKFESEGFKVLLESVVDDLDDRYFREIGRHLEQLRFRDGQLMSAELGPDNSGINLVLRSPGGRSAGWRRRLGIGGRSSYAFTIDSRDQAGADALGDLASRGINLVANAAAQSADHIGSFFKMLRAELGFYVGCVNLADGLRERGVPTCFPQPSESRPLRLSALDLRDASLVLRAGNEVVGNDVSADGKPLLIITGANSGGKSTFLRSVGLAQLMMECGMFTCAREFRSSVCAGIFTHFAREEDGSMVSGRFDQELGRMSVIADRITPGSLILFNESFASTNESEGSEITRQVVLALADSGVRVIFVTHLFDFAGSLHSQSMSTALFLRAQRRPNGRRSYRIEEGDPLPTSFGEDIYLRVGAWFGETIPPNHPLEPSRNGISEPGEPD